MVDSNRPVDEVQEFVVAVQRGDADRVRTLLQRHRMLAANIDERWFPFDAPAIVVARNNRALVDALLDHGADINARSRWWAGGFGVLDGARPAVADYLISRGAVVDAHSAAGLGKLDRLAELVEKDPEVVHARGGDGKRPLHFARSVEVAGFLLEHGARIDARDVDHDSTAAQHLLGERPEVVRFLLERGAGTDVFMAAALGDAELARRHVENEPDCVGHRVGHAPYPGMSDDTGGHIYQWTIGFHLSPHEAALRFGHPDVYDLLMASSPADVRLPVACMIADRPTAEALAAAEPDLVAGLSDRDLQLLAIAAWENKLESVRLMLDLRFNPHVRGPEASTPLDRASFHGFEDVVRLLLERDPEPPLGWRNKYGGTPLSACIHGAVHGWRKDGDHAATAEALIEAGAEFEPGWIPTGSPAIDEVLRRYNR